MRVRSGLWRLWIVGSVAWAAYVAWDSDVACPLALIGVDTDAGPWCEHQNAEPLRYYGSLALRMIGFPLLAGVALVATAWALSGFRSKR